jgi:pSer/pThr/pTyr-binding forkhead associated (FHA) protein
MQVILQIQSGPLTGQVIRLEPGRSERVGRKSPADFVVADDSRMSGVHFVLDCDDKGCVLRDLASSNGTLVNGRRVTTTLLANGDMIVAGETLFSVQVILDKPEAPAPVVAAAPVPSTPQETLIAMLRGDFQPLYALLDAACEPDVLKVLFESKEQYQSLFEGAQGVQLAHFAPYLVRLPEKSPLIATLVQHGWGKSWGVFVTCQQELEALRRHFRHFLMVKLPGRKQAYFRFYDPRVLRLFLPTCTAEEINLIFGPVRYYLMEDEKPDVLLRFSNKGQGVGRRIMPLGAAMEPAAGEVSASPSASQASSRAG